MVSLKPTYFFIGYIIERSQGLKIFMDKNKEEILKLFDLSGEVAIVTGGLGQLGSEYIKILLAAGAKVAAFDVKPGEFQVDVTYRDQVKKAFQKVVDRYGMPTILINNAGIDTPANSSKENGSYEDYPETSWDAVIDSHLKGVFLMSQEFLRLIRSSRKKGSIINISSTYGVVSPDQSLYNFRRKNGEEFYKPAAYSVAKSGVLNFTRWLAEYCRQSGLPVRVNTLVPGGVFADQAEEFLKEYNKRTLLGRMANADEYNAAILFLASNNASSYMTGSTLVIDGGWTAR